MRPRRRAARAPRTRAAGKAGGRASSRNRWRACRWTSAARRSPSSPSSRSCSSLQYAQAMLIPIVLGVLISYALEPPVAGLTRLRIPRPLAAAIVLIAVVWRRRPSGCTASARKPPRSSSSCRRPRGGCARRSRTGSRDTSAIQQVQKAANELEKRRPPPRRRPRNRPAFSACRLKRRRSMSAITSCWGSLGLATAVGQFVLCLFLVYFLLASGDLYRRKLVKIAGPSLTKKKDHAADPRGDRPADRNVPRRAGVHQRARRGGDVARVPLARPRSRPRSGASSPAY